MFLGSISDKLAFAVCCYVSFIRVSEDTSVSDMAPHGCNMAATSLGLMSSCTYIKSQEEKGLDLLGSLYQQVNKG